MVIVVGYKRSDSRLCISHRANILEKGVNPTDFPPAMDKYKGILGSLALLRQPVLKKENSNFKPVELCIKTDLVSHYTHTKGFGEYM